LIPAALEIDRLFCVTAGPRADRHARDRPLDPRRRAAYGRGDEERTPHYPQLLHYRLNIPERAGLLFHIQIQIDKPTV